MTLRLNRDKLLFFACESTDYRERIERRYSVAIAWSYSRRGGTAMQLCFAYRCVVESLDLL